MSISEDIPQLFSALANTHVVQQVAPLLVVFVLPLLVLSAQPHIAHLFRQFYMVLESLALALPWNWKAASSSGSVSDRNKLKKRGAIRTRADQIAVNGDISALAGPSDVASYFEGYYPGLVNLSGSYCFMNATVQAMASLSYLQPHIDQVFNKAESLTNIVHTPVIDELRDLLGQLNSPSSSQVSIRPEEIITALSRYSHGKHNPLFSSRQHQDAQELFQLVSECIKREIAAVDKESYRDRGLNEMAGVKSSKRTIGKSVFDGLTANRRSCKDCGYTEAVMHFGFDNWQLALPRSAFCTLDMLLEDYTRLEELDDCICRRCSMQATHDRLVYEADKLTRAAGAVDASSSKRKRAREARALEAKVKLALKEGRIEDDIKGVQMEKVFSRASTKQAMIARPPAVLVLHLNRSIHYGGSEAARNNCRVSFNEYLDLTPYTTSGQLSTEPSHPISSPPRAPQNYPRYIYRLSAVVCHYGNHYAGHYVCFRRKPRSPSAGSKRWTPPRFVCPLGCGCEKCQRWGPVRDEWDLRNENSASGGWLMASDTNVKEVGLPQVLQEGSGAFMLFYERVIPYNPAHHSHQQVSYGRSSARSASTPPGPISIPATVPMPIPASMSTAALVPPPPILDSSGVYSSTSPKSSEETLRPGMDGSSRSSTSETVNGSTEETRENLALGETVSAIEMAPLVKQSLKHEVEDFKEEEVEEAPVRRLIPRVFMNVSTRKRARSASVPPMERVASSSSSKPGTSEDSLKKSNSPHTHTHTHIPNGDTPHPPITSVSPSTSSQPATQPKSSPSSPSSPKRTKLKKSPPAPLDSPSAEKREPAAATLSPPATPTTPTSPSSPSPSSSPRRNRHRGRQQQQQQQKAPQEPARAKSPPPRPLSPARTVGSLRA